MSSIREVPTLQSPRAINSRNGLGNLRQKLLSAPCEIAYLGASVTAQKEGYRPLLVRWFSETFRQPHRAINAGFGGVGSISGVFMMDDQVISKHPDLCLIEYATGDMGGQTALTEIAGAVEGMVLKLLGAGCHVCLLYLYRRDEDFDQGNPVIAEYERVADHYGIPSLNVGRLIEEQMVAANFLPSDILRDKVHTTADGSRITTELISAGMQAVFDASDETSNRVTPISAAPLVSRNFYHTTIVPAEIAMLRDPDNSATGRFRFAHHYVRVDDTNEIRFTPEGELVGLLVIVGRDAGIIEVETVESCDAYMLWDEWCSYSRLTTVIFRRPVSSGARVCIRLTDKPVPRAADSNFVTQVPRRLHVSGFLVRG